MSLRNTAADYGSAAKFFHWLVAILVIFMILLGASLSYFPPPLRGALITIHKSTGFTVLIVMILRLLWRSLNVSPELPVKLPHWQKVVARTNHWLLYIAITIMPISGFLMSSFGGHKTNIWWLFTINPPVSENKTISAVFGDIHLSLAWIITALLALHISAALRHHFVRKDFVLKRMLPGVPPINHL